MKKWIEWIKNRILKVSLSRELSKRFRKEMQKILITEEKDSDKFNQADYDNCYGRAEAMVRAAAEPTIKMLAYAIAEHRECTHDESHTAEKEVLSKSMTGKEIDISTKAWWKS